MSEYELQPRYDKGQTDLNTASKLSLELIRTEKYHEHGLIMSQLIGEANGGRFLLGIRGHKPIKEDQK